MVVKSLYSILINIFSSLSGSIEIGATWVSLISGTFLIVPLFYLAKWIVGRKVAWISVIITTFNPELVRYSTYILTESMYTFILFMTIVSGYWIMKKRKPFYFWIFSGIIVGISLMSRDVAMIGIPLMLLWISFHGIFSGERSRRIVSSIAIFMAGIILLKGFFAIVHIRKDIKPRPTREMIVKTLITPDLRDFTKREKYLYMLTPDGKEYLYNHDRGENNGVFNLLWKYKGHIAKRFWINLKECIKLIWKSFPVILIVLIVIGVIRNILFYRDVDGPVDRFYLISWGIIYILFYVIAGAYTSALGPERYLVPIFPLLFIWAGMGVEWISELINNIWMRKNKEKPIFMVRYLVIVILTLLIIAFYIPDVKAGIKIRNKTASTKNIYQMLGVVIGDRYPGSLIMSRLPTVPYYAKASWLTIPDEPVERIIKFARYKGVDFLLIDPYTITTRPQLAFLLRKGVKIKGLKRVIALPDPGREGLLYIAVYRVG